LALAKSHKLHCKRYEEARRHIEALRASRRWS